MMLPGSRFLLKNLENVPMPPENEKKKQENRGGPSGQSNICIMPRGPEFNPTHNFFLGTN